MLRKKIPYGKQKTPVPEKSETGGCMTIFLILSSKWPIRAYVLPFASCRIFPCEPVPFRSSTGTRAVHMYYSTWRMQPFWFSFPTGSLSGMFYLNVCYFVPAMKAINLWLRIPDFPFAFSRFIHWYLSYTYKNQNIHTENITMSGGLDKSYLTVMNISFPQ